MRCLLGPQPSPCSAGCPTPPHSTCIARCCPTPSLSARTQSSLHAFSGSSFLSTPALLHAASRSQTPSSQGRSRLALRSPAPCRPTTPRSRFQHAVQRSPLPACSLQALRSPDTLGKYLTPKQIARIPCRQSLLALTTPQAQARPLIQSGSTRPSWPRWTYAARSPRPRRSILQQTSCPLTARRILVPARCHSGSGRFGIAARCRTPTPTARNLSSLIEQQRCHLIAPRRHRAESRSLNPTKLGWPSSLRSIAVRPSSRPVTWCLAWIQPSATAASCVLSRRPYDIASRCLTPTLCARTCCPPILRHRSRSHCQALNQQQ